MKASKPDESDWVKRRHRQWQEYSFVLFVHIGYPGFQCGRGVPDRCGKGKPLPAGHHSVAGNGLSFGRRGDKSCSGIREVFRDRNLLQKFETILQKQARAEERRFLAQRRANGTRLVVLDVPLLIECDWRDDVDSIWLVKTPKELRIRRTMQRDHVSEEEMTFRINSQRPSEEVEQFAHVIIDNSGSFEHTKVQIQENLKKIINI